MNDKRLFINGAYIPNTLTFEECKQLLSSDIMRDFMTACHGLARIGDRQAYETMKEALIHQDKYRRLYVLKLIYQFPDAIELTRELEAAILSQDLLFVSNGLMVAYNCNVRIKEEILLKAIVTNFERLEFPCLSILERLTISNTNQIALMHLFAKAHDCGKQEVLASILYQKYFESHAQELFEVFSQSPYGKVRQYAVRIGVQNGFDLSALQADKDRHVRKLLRRLSEKSK